MFTQSLTAKRSLLNSALLVTLCIVLSATAPGQTQNAAERQRALETFESNNFMAALPLLEKVAIAYPNDPMVLSRLGFALYAVSVEEKDAAQRHKMRERAKSILLKSQSLGDDSNLTQMAVDALSAGDASNVPFSDLKSAETAMREGEAAFVRGDMDKALAAYQRALAVDPKLYDAALYAGDVEYKKAMSSNDATFRTQHFDAAAVWFSRAIGIDWNRETAHRYWGDALDAQGKTNEARDRFVDAIVAAPYNRNAYVGLSQWGQRHNVALGHPRIDIPSNVSSSKPGEINITVDDMALKGGSDDGSAAWMMYGIARASWMDGKDGKHSEKFAKAYPQETKYRHSLAEELDGLRGVVEAVQTQTKEKRIKTLTPSLENLMRLHEVDLIEPYVLFVRPDQGIAQDYLSYRAAHRDKLQKYWLQVVISPR